MSLVKQIRIAISVIILMVAAGCLFLGVYDDHRFMAEQLQKKNNDNANGLAITLSNIQKDNVTVELIVSAQFDMGHYRRIAIVSPDNTLMIERVNRHPHANAPAWFQYLCAVDIQPGVANIQSGWQQYGTLVLESEASLAYDQLWDTSRHAVLWTLVVAFLSYIVSGLWLKKILKPLDDVIAQAEALGDRKYITIAEPATEEFRKLVQTMNMLSERVKSMVTAESERLNTFNQQINYDEVTGLMNQSHFTNSASVALKHEGFVEGMLVLVQLRNLPEIDKQLGYSMTNQLIKKVGDALQQQMTHYQDVICGRLAGGVFGIFSRQPLDDFAVTTELKLVLEKLNAAQQLLQFQFVITHTKTKKGDDFADIHRVMEFILDLAEDQTAVPMRVMNANSIVTSRKNYLNQWKQQFLQAIEQKQIKLACYPVMQRHQQLYHYECPLRLHIDEGDQWLAAGAFIDWASQLDMIKTLDGMALEHAVEMLSKNTASLSVNVSAAAMRSDEYRDKLQALMLTVSQPARLSFEVAEEAAFSDFGKFKEFVNLVKTLGCMVGLEHVATRLAQLGDLHELGLDYAKFDASLIRDIHLRPQQQSLLRGLCMMVRTMGIVPIAEGVQDQQELDSLNAIGIEAVTGPFVQESLQFGEV
ncbi:EAL domain-containing protein [Methylophilus medardicus]|uniref:EAL domain-containing protein n=1 Tax=Methylophilus medardicus TaxID=2588534 RepID=A0A5B8CT44_9PROT|nr:EAL domain-containing protein [Methylophilus medardicus]QDC44389.1 EAL domain-containing protein [Methylophilus medardicus]QDC49396.1 EAL domain-containing protein [Methylophilus medardicus]QDC53101.1 EAL domain-containing protein [Methylophilus medardicus]